ncbi:NAD(P)-binding protein [Stipitochalara longipes BDJ]|nr:NAD(P)-binding protein [Stipitochalara longipes BDJ]
MTTSAKVRVGLVGLNAPYSGAPTETNWAASSHLPYLLSSSKYELVALQNSSAERAALAIKAYDLNPAKVRAYGTPEELASDPNVDLVVTSIRVDRHAGSLIPAIKAGKDVYVEWPIDSNYTKAKELTDLVKFHGVRNVVGLQDGFTPIATKIRKLIAAGEIGRVKSSTFVGKMRGGAVMASNVDYFLDKEIGGNAFTISFGHSMEYITRVLGEVSTFHSLLVNQYPEVTIVEPTTNEAIEVRKNDVPTQVIFDAILDSGVILTYKLHTSANTSPFAEPPKRKTRLPGLDWRIFGSKGEIRVTGYTKWSLNVDDGEVVTVDVGRDEFEHLPVPARNIARLYEAFASGKSGEKDEVEWYPDFEYALRKHEVIEEMYAKDGF